MSVLSSEFMQLDEKSLMQATKFDHVCGNSVLEEPEERERG